MNEAPKMKITHKVETPEMKTNYKETPKPRVAARYS